MLDMVVVDVHPKLTPVVAVVVLVLLVKMDLTLMLT